MLNCIILDGITRIRNGYKAKLPEIELCFSNLTVAFLDVLKKEGYIEDIEIFEEDNKKTIGVKLKYVKNKSAIREIYGISKPGQRIYSKHNKIPVIANYFGCIILTTNKGVMTSHEAKVKKLGGELLAKIF
jgi:small subunit ribosomal protein S8